MAKVTGVQFYRDNALPFLEIKFCDTKQLSYKKHVHDEYSLGFVETGRSRFWYEGRTDEVFPHSMLLIPPGLVHSCNPLPKGHWSYRMAFIASEWLDGLNEWHQLNCRPQPVQYRLSPHTALRMARHLFDALTGLSGPLAKEALLITALEELFHAAPALSKPPAEPVRLKQVREYILSHFNEKITLDQLAKVSGLNKFGIIRAFNEKYSVPPHTYQNVLRINFAKKALRELKPITDVTYEAGFYDQSHFCKIFKSQTGVTPQRYQKLL